MVMHPMFDFGNRELNPYIEEELELQSRHDSFMIESDSMLWTEEYDREEGYSYPIQHNPLFDFKVFKYNELVQNYEIDISSEMTEDENWFIQNKLYEIYCDRCGADE